jgi:SHS family lactate transporter-like MFS transporter
MAATDGEKGPVPGQQQQPLHHGMSVGEYLRSRISTLKPPLLDAPNPVRLLRSPTGRQWAFFFVAFAAWVGRFRDGLESDMEWFVL